MPWQPGMRHGWGALFRSPTAASPPAPGVGNNRAELSRQTLGVPVVSMGIPTVVDCRTLLHDLGLPTPPGVPESLVVTPKDVDLLIDRGAHLIGMAVNRAAQPLLTAEEIALLIA